MNKQNRFMLTIAVGLFSLSSAWQLSGSNVYAQLAPDVRDMFELLVEELDADLARKFRKAINDNSATIEFTPEQFRRFRSSDANPFDGLDEVDARDGSGNVALKFELPSLRKRNIAGLERQHPSQLNQLLPVAPGAHSHTVALADSLRQLALAIVIDSNGLIITKASEVETIDNIYVMTPGGGKVPAKLLRVDSRNDVALLSVDATYLRGLSPVRWSESQPKLGSFVVTPGADGEVLAMGSYSSNVRSTASGEQAFLGVQPQTRPEGVLIQQVEPGTASYQAGLRDGDIITRLADQVIQDVPDLVHTIRLHRPGDKISIDYLRGAEFRSTIAKLDGRRLSGERASRFKMMSRLGAIPSRRDDGFPVVFQHDAPLFPEQCGGPILDLNGNVIGMNIARSGRAATYAIPANHLVTVVERLLGESIAQLQSK